MRQRSERREAGFTLIELMIALVLFSFAIAGVLAVAVSMTQGYREQRAAVEAESSVRVPIDFIVDAIRQSSPGAPTGNIQDAGTCSNGALTISNNQTSVSNNPTISGWDSLDVIYASGGVVTSSRTAYTTGTTSIDVDDASQLASGDSIVISDTNQGHLVKITGITNNTLSLANQCSTIVLPASGYPAGSLVVRAQHAVFTIDSVDTIPTLMMDPDAGGSAAPQPLAEGVEDLQFAIGVDTNGDNQVTETGLAANDDEWQGNFAGDSVLSGTLRALRVSMVARTTSGLIGSAAPFTRPALEDHAAATTGDQYRRRVLKTIVEIRNMGESP